MWLSGQTAPDTSSVEPAHTRCGREQPRTRRRCFGKPAWYSSAAVATDATGAALPVYLAFSRDDETHALRCEACGASP